MTPKEAATCVVGFVLGMPVGVLLLMATLACLGESPYQVEEHWKLEATKRGYGGMVLEGDRFVWKWNEEKTDESE